MERERDRGLERQREGEKERRAAACLLNATAGVVVVPPGSRSVRTSSSSCLHAGQQLLAACWAAGVRTPL